LGFLGAETLKHQTLFTLYHFEVSPISISRLANTRELALGFPECRNTKTPKYIHAIPFQGFTHRDFTTDKYKGTCPWGFRVLKRRNTKIYSCYTILGFHPQGFQLVNTRELSLGFPGCRNTETPKSIHVIPFRGFTHRDFATGEYKGTFPWVSRVPKHRPTATCPLQMDDPDNSHGSWDLWSRFLRYLRRLKGVEALMPTFLPPI
jgi:hypothetical protein